MNRSFRHDCRLFSGYRPCPYGCRCEGCSFFQPRGTRVLFINLDSQGDVLRNTSILPAIRRAHPGCTIHWLTLPNAAALLQGNHLIDHVWLYDAEMLPVLQKLEFGLVLNVDKGRLSGSLAELARAGERRGFGMSGEGAIRPLNPEAEYSFALGLDNDLKFFRNTKTDAEVSAEALGFAWGRDEYILNLSAEEREASRRFRLELGVDPDETVLGFNVGCSAKFSYKKLTVAKHVEVIRALRRRFSAAALPIMLLGGREDTEHCRAIAAAFGAGDRVMETPTTQGLRRGIVWMDAADVVVSGDSLGMHLAIGLKKRVVAWFGITCEQEIDLYDRGEKVISPVACRPCWKQRCNLEPKCYDEVRVEDLAAAAERQLALCREERKAGTGPAAG